MISKRIENIIKYSYFEIKIKRYYIHKFLNNHLNDYIKKNNLKVNSKHNFEEGVFIELDNLKIIGIIPINSDSIYSNISQSYEIKDFTFVSEHFIHNFLAKKKNFNVEINNKKYFIEFTKEPTRYKPLNISITRYYKDKSFLFEQKQYYKIRRRLYNNIICINKLKDGLIRKYRVYNEFEIEVLQKYLTNKNILFRIIEKTSSYIRKYNISDKSYKYCYYNDGYPEKNKVYKSTCLYIEIYKGYVNLKNKNNFQYKYGIYLY